MLRFVAAALSLFIGLQAFAETPNRSTCVSLVELEKDELKIAEDRFAVGEVTSVAVNKARLDLYKTQFECRAVLFPNFCQVAVPTANDIVISVIEEERLGLAELADVKAAKAELLKLKSLCL